MAANIHAVALVSDGARDAADLLACFDEDGLNPRTPLKLDRSRESGWARSDDDRSLICQNISSFEGTGLNRRASARQAIARYALSSRYRLCAPDARSRKNAYDGHDRQAETRICPRASHCS
jgi:hypothetical protein